MRRAIEIKSGMEGARNAYGSAVIIDVSRTSSTVATAIYRGASSVVPVTEKRFALELYNEWGEADCLLVTDEGDLIQSGCLDNSPTLLSRLDIRGKRIILLTANGSKGIVYSSGAADEVLVGCFLNAEAIAEYLRERDNITLVPVGDSGEKAEEDEICAEYMKAAILGEGPGEDKFKERIIDSGSMQYLVDRGRGDDFEYCLRFNELPVVPKLIGDRLIGI